jgi:hypothetical protein
VADAQTEGLVDASTINEVQSIQVAVDGSAQITLSNGQVVGIAAAYVTVAVNGAVLISAAVAEIVVELALAVGVGGGSSRWGSMPVPMRSTA